MPQLEITEVALIYYNIVDSTFIEVWFTGYDLTVITNRSILDVAAVLDPPLGQGSQPLEVEDNFGRRI